jgi:hypothetical protein
MGDARTILNKLYSQWKPAGYDHGMGDSGDNLGVQSRCRWRRIITPMLVFLLLVAIVNVAVASVCVVMPHDQICTHNLETSGEGM